MMITCSSNMHGSLLRINIIFFSFSVTHTGSLIQFSKSTGNFSFCLIQINFAEGLCMDKSTEAPDSSQALPRVATGTGWLELAEMCFVHPPSCSQLKDGQRPASCTNPFQPRTLTPTPVKALGTTGDSEVTQLSSEHLGVGNDAASLPDRLAKPPELRGEKTAIKSSARRDFMGMFQSSSWKPWHLQRNKPHCMAGLFFPRFNPFLPPGRWVICLQSDFN